PIRSSPECTRSTPAARTSSSARAGSRRSPVRCHSLPGARWRTRCGRVVDGPMPPAKPEAAARCPWAKSEAMWSYHDREWGVPVHDDRRHFEFLILEGAQAGLSWSTILGKRDGYRRAFADFDPDAVARFTAKRMEKLIADPGIVRNRLKVQCAVSNARAFVKLRDERGGFDGYIWSFVDGAPIVNRWKRT